MIKAETISCAAHAIRAHIDALSQQALEGRAEAERPRFNVMGGYYSSRVHAAHALQDTINLYRRALADIEAAEQAQ